MPASVGTPKVPDRVLRKIRITYFSLYIISTVISIVLIVMAYFAMAAETKISFLELHITKAVSILFYFVGGSIIVATALGILGKILNNPYLWILYSMLMAIICLAAIAGAGSALDQQTKAIRKEMKDLIGRYKDGNTTIDKGAQTKVDKFQTEFECCGVDNYTDWQDVEFGRTSLKLPISCCKPINGFGQPRDEFCGDLCLPVHVNLTQHINVDGCFEKMANDIRLILIFLGLVGLAAFFLTGFTFVFTCYLIISKKIDTRPPRPPRSQNAAVH